MLCPSSTHAPTQGNGSVCHNGYYNDDGCGDHGGRKTPTKPKDAGVIRA